MAANWPALPYDEWRETRDTLHRWTQIVGKIRMTLTPLVNHWWNAPLYVTAHGLTTSKMSVDGGRALDIEFDFLAHVLRFRVSDGRAHDIALGPRTVADLYREIFEVLRLLEVRCAIWTMPVEIPGETRALDRDHDHHHYDHDAVERFWRILSLCDGVFTEFRSRFIGKCSPVHFFWGSFDLAVTRFSGRVAPQRADADAVTREAYSHEVSSVGFWPGDDRLKLPSFYSYAAPEPEGFRTARVTPAATYYNEALGGFYLHYDDVRASHDPEAMLLDYCQTTYEAAADNAQWDRAALERAPQTHADSVPRAGAE
ncbi:MAG TPA: DUF5996 family protein [Thermoanaerobaculia bacterium]|nr:DUF5996 family protein [Thermoanaerobaculia bacterium]